MDSIKENNIPKGLVNKYTWKSNFFNIETNREFYIYVPIQYTPKTPLGLMIFNDGKTYLDDKQSFRVPIVFDNLIHKKIIPPILGLFINPGHTIEYPLPDKPYQASNRSWEYDSMSDLYVRFLIEELIPEIQKNYNLTSDRKMRAICGISSGGICAFTAAWERSDYFHKVMSHIGSFTNIRGGHVYPSLIRQSTKRDIRIFLQDGSNDLNNSFGDWWLSNLQMESALKYRGYDIKFVGGTGEHDSNHGGAILPESLEWLWRK